MAHDEGLVPVQNLYAGETPHVGSTELGLTLTPYPRSQGPYPCCLGG